MGSLAILPWAAPGACGQPALLNRGGGRLSQQKNPRAVPLSFKGQGVEIAHRQQNRPRRSLLCVAEAPPPDQSASTTPSLTQEPDSLKTPRSPPETPAGQETSSSGGTAALIGEDAAVFDTAAQSLSSWGYFFGVLFVVLAILYFAWLDPNTGYGGAFIHALETFSDRREVVMLALLLVFGIVHSGGAGLRASAEKMIGERAYRVLFAGISLPLAVSSVVYFINHRYTGVQMWDLHGVPGMHELVWALSFVSFFFLYPSTFNLLEVAAVDKPKVHMWETGIMRITRHPQMAGQLIWCIAHTLWIGTSFTLVTSLGLLAHHAFGVWHGDRRLSSRYGLVFDQVKSRTSIIPFAAILDGRQRLPADYYKEFLRVPYFAIVAVTIGAYFSHPLMQQGSFWLRW